MSDNETDASFFEKKSDCVNITSKVMNPLDGYAHTSYTRGSILSLPLLRCRVFTRTRQYNSCINLKDGWLCM